jgi:hypothetical protein
VARVAGVRLPDREGGRIGAVRDVDPAVAGAARHQCGACTENGNDGRMLKPGANPTNSEFTNYYASLVVG